VPTEVLADAVKVEGSVEKVVELYDVFVAEASERHEPI